jgi:hypothetical protein
MMLICCGGEALRTRPAGSLSSSHWLHCAVGVSAVVCIFLPRRPLVDGNPVNGVRFTYDPTLLTQRALFMQGGISDYNTPGMVRQLGALAVASPSRRSPCSCHRRASHTQTPTLHRGVGLCCHRDDGLAMP